MVKTNYYSGLNPVVVQALNNLQYRYSGEIPEMWYSHVHYLFKKLLEYNPKYFSKNGFIHMTERSYKDGEFKAGRRSFYIYCTVCDSLVTIRENTIKCANNHLNKCIARTAKRCLVYSNPIWKNVKKGEEYHRLALVKLMRYMINILYIHSMVLILVILQLNLGKGLYIPYLTMQKLSNGLGELTS